MIKKYKLFDIIKKCNHTKKQAKYNTLRTPYIYLAYFYSIYYFVSVKRVECYNKHSALSVAWFNVLSVERGECVD